MTVTAPGRGRLLASPRAISVQLARRYDYAADAVVSVHLVGLDVRVYRLERVQPYPIRLVNWFMSK